MIGAGDTLKVVDDDVVSPFYNEISADAQGLKRATVAVYSPPNDVSDFNAYCVEKLPLLGLEEPEQHGQPSSQLSPSPPQQQFNKVMSPPIFFGSSPIRRASSCEHFCPRRPRRSRSDVDGLEGEDGITTATIRSTSSSLPSSTYLRRASSLDDLSPRKPNRRESHRTIEESLFNNVQQQPISIPTSSYLSPSAASIKPTVGIRRRSSSDAFTPRRPNRRTSHKDHDDGNDAADILNNNNNDNHGDDKFSPPKSPNSIGTIGSKSRSSSVDMQPKRPSRRESHKNHHYHDDGGGGRGGYVLPATAALAAMVQNEIGEEMKNHVFTHITDKKLENKLASEEWDYIFQLAAQYALDNIEGGGGCGGGGYGFRCGEGIATSNTRRIAEEQEEVDAVVAANILDDFEEETDEEDNRDDDGEEARYATLAPPQVIECSDIAKHVRNDDRYKEKQLCEENTSYVPLASDIPVSLGGLGAGSSELPSSSTLHCSLADDKTDGTENNPSATPPRHTIHRPSSSNENDFDDDALLEEDGDNYVKQELKAVEDEENTMSSTASGSPATTATTKSKSNVSFGKVNDWKRHVFGKIMRLTKKKRKQIKIYRPK